MYIHIYVYIYNYTYIIIHTYVYIYIEHHIRESPRLGNIFNVNNYKLIQLAKDKKREC